MTDISDLIADGEGGYHPTGEADARHGLHPHPWWAWTLGAQLLSLGSLVGAGALLADARLGTSLRDRACDASLLPGIALLLCGGLFLVLGYTLSRLHVEGTELGWDWSTLTLALPVPATLLALTLPGLLGCAAASDISDIPLVGDALVGQSGVMLAAASAALSGAAAAAGAHVGWPESGHVHNEERPGLVELAIQEAEAMRVDPAASRFHGVDSGE